jgi:hypothetical protein
LERGGIVIARNQQKQDGQRELTTQRVIASATEFCIREPKQSKTICVHEVEKERRVPVWLSHMYVAKSVRDSGNAEKSNSYLTRVEKAR